jgi:hypothetical protein
VPQPRHALYWEMTAKNVCRQIQDFVPVLGGDHIRGGDVRFGPTAACSLEAATRSAWTTHRLVHELKTKISARGLIALTAI